MFFKRSHFVLIFCALLLITTATSSKAKAFLEIGSNDQHGGQALLLVNSDDNLGVFGETFERLPIQIRKNYYGYDKTVIINGAEFLNDGQLGVVEGKLKKYAVVDVLLFAHGGPDTYIYLRRSGRHFAISPETFGTRLKLLKGKLRMVYSSTCDLDGGLKKLVHASGAAVGVGHHGVNAYPLTFPFKFLRHFKVEGQGAYGAARAAYYESVYNVNPVMRFIYNPIIEAVFQNAASEGRPVISGDKGMSGWDMVPTATDPRTTVDEIELPAL